MNPNAPQPLLSPVVHASALAATLAIVTATVSFAGSASEEAVQSARAAISPAVRYITLQPVEVVYRRGAQPMADSCANVQPRT